MGLKKSWSRGAKKMLPMSGVEKSMRGDERVRREEATEEHEDLLEDGVKRDLLDNPAIGCKSGGAMRCGFAES